MKPLPDPIWLEKESRRQRVYRIDSPAWIANGWAIADSRIDPEDQPRINQILTERSKEYESKKEETKTPQNAEVGDTVEIKRRGRPAKRHKPLEPETVEPELQAVGDGL